MSMDVNLGSKRIKELRESNLTIADLRQQIGLPSRELPKQGALKTKAQIKKLGRSVQRQVDSSSPRGRNGTQIKQRRFRKKPTD